MSGRRKARVILIDRDGVINKDPGGWTPHSYVTKREELIFLPGALEALRLLNRSGFTVLVISNQAGVSKGYFTHKELDTVNRLISGEVERFGGKITRSYYCTHKSDDNCNCRKPKTGLLEMAARDHGYDPHNTYFIGDSEGDIIAGRRMGVRTILVLSGKTSAAEVRAWTEKPDCVFDDLLQAVRWMIDKDKRKAARARRREGGGPRRREGAETPDSDEREGDA